MCSAVVWCSTAPSAWLPSSPCSCLCLWQHQQQLLQRLFQQPPAGWPECCLCLQNGEVLSNSNNDTTARRALPGKVHGLGALECLSCLVPYSGCSIPLFHADACKLVSCDMQSKATYRIAVGVHGFTHEQSNAWTKSQNQKLIVTIELKIRTIVTNVMVTLGKHGHQAMQLGTIWAT